MLNKLKNDIKFIDVETGEVSCTHNQCFKKFDRIKVVREYTPKWNEGRPIRFYAYVHECKECGRRVESRKDKRESIISYESAISGHDLSLENELVDNR